ncbi:hypothetical protein CTAYLR_001319 [Chrysophaeum taylorii]|uniref:glucan endo-1,3-beta-D-glucosidase n=1 Tax=Chrysophaeum taylorii TaxID=2483200 RepID=A0AAD7U648_9STRA|nr:hypothetical protein CTAYLR_001319 [Chrysophaeum taylorii]
MCYQSVCVEEGGSSPASPRKARSGTAVFVGMAFGVGLLLGTITWGRHLAYAHGARVPPPQDLKGDTAAWVPFEAAEHPLRPTSIWGNVRRPYPTGAWWTNLVVGGPSSDGDGLGPAMQTPYAVAVTPSQGVALSYGALSADNKSLTISASRDVGISLVEGVARRYVMTYDDLTMTMRLEGNGGGTMDALFARGSPYVTVMVEEAAFELASDFEISAVRVVGDSEEDDDSRPRECKAYPSCVSAKMSGECCPMDREHGFVVHPCCAGPVGAQGPAERFSLELRNGQFWRVYTSRPVSLKWTEKKVVSAAPFTGILRVALVPDLSGLSGSASFEKIESDDERNATLKVPDGELLDAHAESYPTSGAARVTADRSRTTTVGYVEFSWRVAYMGSTLSLDSETKTPKLLMLALAHHRESMVADDSVGFMLPGTLDFRGGLKGAATPVLGARWTMREDLTSISWRPDRELRDREVRERLVEQLEIDVARPPGETDEKAAWIAYNDWFGNAYWNGKECARLAGLALVAEDLQHSKALESASNQMRAILDTWLEAKNVDPLMYDATYGGLCTKVGLYDHDADFGNGYYNDHHFHYGYMLYAAAVAVKLDAGFAAKYRRALFALLYDVANPGSGASFFEPGIDREAFPRARHKDFYDGHSWASGIFYMGQGKAQESSTEAINAYYGAYLLALAFGDVELADWNRVLLAMEIRASKLYYHMPRRTPIYPKAFASNKVVGVLGALSTGSTTWFGPSPAFSHGIQTLPVTPITELVLQPATFIREDLKYLDAHLDRDSCEDSWLAFVECIRATVDAKTAFDNINALAEVDPGTTKTALLYWAATRPPPDAPADPDFFH